MTTEVVEKAFEKLQNDINYCKKVILDSEKVEKGGEKIHRKVKVFSEKVNKSQLIRDCFENLGKNARPKDVIEKLRKEHGVDVAASLVSITKSKMNGNSEKVEKKPEVEKVYVSLPNAVKKALDENKDGLGIKELSQMIDQFGYEYNGDKGEKGKYNNVYQCVHALSQEKAHPGYEGTEPVVIHDKSKHVYYLNPKAQKSA